MTLACGIDFGTSNSSVGVCDADGHDDADGVLPNELPDSDVDLHL